MFLKRAQDVPDFFLLFPFFSLILRHQKFTLHIVRPCGPCGGALSRAAGAAVPAHRAAHDGATRGVSLGRQVRLQGGGRQREGGYARHGNGRQSAGVRQRGQGDASCRLSCGLSGGYLPMFCRVFGAIFLSLFVLAGKSFYG